MKVNAELLLSVHKIAFMSLKAHLSFGCQTVLNLIATAYGCLLRNFMLEACVQRAGANCFFYPLFRLDLLMF